MMTLSTLVKEHGVSTGSHHFRSSFRDRAAEGTNRSPKRRAHGSPEGSSRAAAGAPAANVLLIVRVRRKTRKLLILQGVTVYF